MTASKLLTIFICASLSGCSSLDNSNDIYKSLIGSWVLDSTSTGKCDNLDSSVLIFKNNTDYSYEWHNGDVGNTFIGKYFILDNPKRGLKTITLIPDLQIDGKDTIRIEFMNYDIVSINANKIQLVDATKFIKRFDTSVKFNKNYIYIRKR